MRSSADIVVIGAGIIGMSAAFQIARRSTARIIVLDKGMGPGEGSTGASSAVCRFRYSYSEVVQLAKDGIGAYQHWAEFLGNRSPYANYQRIGVLWLSNEREWAAHEADRLNSLGCAAAAIDDQELAERFPAINPCGVTPDLVGGESHACSAGGRHLLEADGGYMDPVDALQDLIVASKARGVEARFNAAVEDILVEGSSVNGVRLTSGEVISCGTVVEAAGPWCIPFLARNGLASRWSLEPTRIQMVHIDRPPSLKGPLPVCADIAAGIYFRPQNAAQQIVVGSVRDEDERECVADPDDFARYADDAFIHPKLFALQHRLGLEEIRGPIRSYSGLYTINRADMHPIVGGTPIAGLYLANGCSGHGFKLAPAIGSLLAQQITGDRLDFDTGVDPNFLAYDREPIRLASMTVIA